MISSPPSRKFKVLVVDDGPCLREMIQSSLACEFVVEEAGTSGDAIAAVKQKPYEIVLLDVNMSGVSGMEVCRQIRALSPKVGIVMVTVVDSEEEKVRALEAGADDYVAKPFRFRELVARLEAASRKGHAAAAGVLEVGDMRLDLELRLLWKGGKQIRLSPKEFDLLACLMRNPGAPMTHVTLLRAVWGPEYGGELEYLGFYVRMLRKKIEDDPARPQYLLTEDWVGYRFRDPSEPGQPEEHMGAR